MASPPNPKPKPAAKQEVSSYLPLPELKQIPWCYLTHPSGRRHRINPNEERLIQVLVKWGWTP